MHAFPALAQWVMWNLPILLFWAICRLSLPDSVLQQFSRFLIGLIAIQFMLGLLQIPNIFKYGDTEEIVGTFYGNATQYQGFLMLGLFMVIAHRSTTGFLGMKLRLLFVSILLLILAIDNKASWLGVSASLVFVFLLSEGGGLSLRLQIF
jgi:hypothetical protein